MNIQKMCLAFGSKQFVKNVFQLVEKYNQLHKIAIENLLQPIKFGCFNHSVFTVYI
jgi:hypothetical protein